MLFYHVKLDWKSPSAILCQLDVLDHKCLRCRIATHAIHKLVEGRVVNITIIPIRVDFYSSIIDLHSIINYIMEGENYIIMVGDLGGTNVRLSFFATSSCSTSEKVPIFTWEKRTKDSLSLIEDIK